MDSIAAHYAPIPQPQDRGIVLVHPSLWTRLTDSDPEPPTRLVLALHALHGTPAGSKQLGTLLVRAQEATKAEAAAVEGVENLLLVPRALLEAHPAVFNRTSSCSPTPTSRPSLGVSRSTPIALSSVILTALDADSYANAQSAGSDLDERLARPDRDLVRQGAVVHVSGLGRWKVAMTEPVMQGGIVRKQTRLLVLPPTKSAEAGSAEAAGGTSTSASDALADDDGDEDDEPSGDSSQDAFADFDLDEAFLASSVLLPRKAHATPLTSPLPAHLDTHKMASFPMLEYSRTLYEETGPLVGAAPLDFAIPAELLTPEPDADEDDNWRAFVSTQDLGRLGLFSGDWAVLRQPASSASGGGGGGPTPCRRLIRVFAADACLPTFALKGSNKRRKVVKGDVIAVGIAEDKIRFVRDVKDDAPPEEEIELPQASEHPTAVVYFVVTALALDSSSATQAATGDVELDAEIEEGLLGCYVDPQVTKLVQTGVERARIPNVAGWLGCESAKPDASNSSSAPLTNILDNPTPASRLNSFVLSALTPQAASYALPLSLLLHGARGSGKRTLLRQVARDAGIGILELDCYDLIGDTDAKTEGRLRALAVDKALACAPVVLVLRNIEALARKSQAMETGQEPPMTTVLRECFETLREGWTSSHWPVIVAATTTDVEKVPTGVLGLFKEEIALEAPGEPERLAILRSLTASDLIAPDASLRALAVQTAALVATDLVDLVRRARSAAVERVMASNENETKSAPTLADIRAAGLSLTSLDFNAALDKARSAYSESIGAPKIPNVTWDDVGGLANVKSDILDTIQLPLEHPELFADGLKKRSGILLYGPPGTGKTLLAKAVATSCSLNFFSVKGPELLNMYIGESEANVRRVFQRARDAKPCVIFFDELDSVAPKRGNQGDSGGVMDRIVSQLLAELDGMSEGKGGNDVFVIGATNRPDLLDPALLRPGRFDRMLYLGVSDNHNAQLKIMQALTRKFKLAPDTDLQRLAEQCPFNYTGADFYALCSDAMLKAMTRKAGEIDQRISELNAQPPYSTGAAPLLTPQYFLAEIATPAEINVLVAQQDFEAALAELVPSVSQAEMQHYKTVQQRFSAETMNSDDKLAEKEKEKQAATAGAVRLAAPLELPPPRANGLVGNGRGSGSGLPNGYVSPDEDRPNLINEETAADEKEEEEEKARRRRAKGKGKARAD
ncbi:AAA-domain-containing protein [Rhodotorula sp. JG-1b]|nr:AAA-domain-containing protein [Rhodotorula sp. JG-1b]